MAQTPFEARVREVATQTEEELRRVVTYINDEVVPEVRRNGAGALQFAAAELRKLAERLESANQRTPPKP